MYNPEFKHESTTTSTMRFMIVAANGIPMRPSAIANGEELGAMGLIAVAGLFAVLAWRGFRIGRLASSDYGFFLATALTLFLIVPALIMASGIMGITPLTGVVTPFLSYGGSAMLANFAALGLLAAIHRDRRPPNDFAPFRMPMRYLGGVLAVCALALAGAGRVLDAAPRAGERRLRRHGSPSGQHLPARPRAPGVLARGLC